MKSTRLPKLAWHFDLHTPGNVRINHNPRTAEIARELKAAGVEAVITFAKCHHGYAYFPTRVGTRHPRMKGDALGGVIRACHQQGIKVLAYLSFGIDGQAAMKHPDWLQRRHDGKPLTHNPNWFSCVCPFTAYLDRLMLPQIAEVAKWCRPDGLWFDTMSALAPCYCKTCRTEFRKATGKEIPHRDNDPLWGTFGKWRHDRGVAMVERVAAFIQSVLPGGAVGFNQLGSLYYPEPMARGVTELSLDPPTYGPQSLQFGMNAAFGGTTGVDCEVMPTIMNQGWGDWSLATEKRIEQVAATIWARGVRLIYGDRLHPDTRLTPVTKRALKIVGSLRKRLGAEFPAADARAVPDVLILHGNSVTCGDDFEDFARRPRDRMGRISGAYQLCLDAGLNASIVAECYLASWLDRARVIITPELTSISRETEAQLRRFVENGGRLLVAGPIPTVNKKPLDWLGVRAESKPWQDHIYLPSWKGSREMTVLVRGDFHRVKLAGARSVMKAIPAFDARHGTKYGWGIGPSSDKPSPHPALTVRKLGRGEVWHLGAPMFTDYSQHGNWQQAEWFRHLLHSMRADHRACLESASGNVELVLWENERTSWAILVHHGGEQLIGTGTMNWSRVVSSPPKTDLVVHLRRREGRKARSITMSGQRFRYAQQSSTIRCPVTLTDVWSMLRVEWE